jgi:hypothetical protein
MKKICTLLLLVVASLHAYSQGTLLWEKIIPMPYREDAFMSTESHNKTFWVALGNDVVPRTPPLCSTQGCVFSAGIVAYNQAGDTLWHRNFYEYYQLYTQPWGVVKAPNNHFWAAIVFDYELVGYKSGIAVFEMDSIGQVLSVREFLKDCHFLQHQVESMYPMPDGGFVLSGHMTRSVGCNTDTDIFALRVDGDGNQVWQQTYNYSGNQNALRANLYPNNRYCISVLGSGNKTSTAWIDTQTGNLLSLTPTAHYITGPDPRNFAFSDGSYVMIGEKTLSASPWSLGRLVMMRPNATKVWEKDYTQVRYWDNIIETKDNCFLVFGGGYGLVIAKIRKIDGIVVWQRTLQGVPRSMTVASNGNFHVFGSKNNDYYVAMLQDVADFLQPSDYCTDSVRANFTGTWQQDTLRLRSTSNSGMAYQDSLNYQWLIEGNTVSLDSAVQQVKEAALYPNGLPVTLVITNFWGCKDTLTAKVMPDGTVVGNRPVETLHATSLRNAYPNPSTQNVSIGYTLPTKTENAVLRVYELGTGRTVAERNLSALDSDVKLNVSGWATGVYAYQLFVNGAPVAVKKMTVSR